MKAEKLEICDVRHVDYGQHPFRPQKNYPDYCVECAEQRGDPWHNERKTMTVSELIYQLARFDPNTKVVMAHNWEAPNVAGLYMNPSDYMDGPEPTVALHIGELEPVA